MCMCVCVFMCVFYVYLGEEYGDGEVPLAHSHHLMGACELAL